jgi:chorismate mutase / prephenate dehydratase
MPRPRGCRRGSAARCPIAGDRPPRLYGLQIWRREHRGRAQQHHALPGDRPQDAAPSGRDKTSAGDGSNNQPGACQAAAAARRCRHQHDQARVAAVASGNWEYVFFVDCEGHREDAAASLPRWRKSSKRAAFLKILGSYPKAASS